MATDVLREAKKKVVPLSAADPSISIETSRIVERAMAYEPADRFDSYDELIASLAVSLSHVKSGRAESTGSSAQRRAGKKRREMIVVAAGILAVIASAGAAIWWLNRPKPEPLAGLPPPVQPVVPPAAPDHSADIARSYREARASMETGDFESAATRFRALLKNPDVQEPTRSWAGLEAVMAHYLNGRPADARTQAVETLEHLRSLPQDARRIDGEMADTLAKLSAFRPIPSPAAGSSGNGASRVVSAMLAGLKNWEQGMIGPAAESFRAAAAAKLPPEDEWAAVYQKLAGDYLADHQTLSGPLFTNVPADKAGCEAAIEGLNGVLANLKTRGRARFNVRAWQLDLARRAKLLESAASGTPAPADVAPLPAPNLSEVLTRLGELSRELQFREAVTYLESLPADPEGATRSSLRAVAASSAVFLSDLERDLAVEPVSADLKLHSGETVTKVAIHPQGGILATSADGRARPCEWTDFPPDALIALHRVIVRNPKSETERLRRHECAIAFDWLAGNRERALAAASVLSQTSPAFKQRWDEISSGLPK